MSSDSQQGAPEQSVAERERRQREEMSRFLAALLEPGDIVELRAKDFEVRAGFVAPGSGYYDDLGRFADDAIAMTGKAAAVYVTMNKINPVLLARRKNEFHWLRKGDPTTADNEMIRRRWLLVDLDPVRVSGISSTDAEHAAAIAKAREIRGALTSDGWPLPVMTDTGNGAALLYRIDVPPDDGELVKRALVSLSLRFSSTDVSLDTSVHNPARLVRLPGTRNCKGSHTDERPHRWCRILDLPDQVGIVAEDLLRAWALEPERGTVEQTSQIHRGRFDLERWIAEHLPEADGPVPWGGGRKWVLPVCPWDPSHTNRSAYVLVLPSGAIAAGCLHNSCQAKKWHDLRDLLQPGWRESKQNGTGTRTRSSSSRAGSGGIDGDAGSTTDQGPANESPPAREWPDELAREALHGPAGQFVEVLSPHTESDPAGLLFTFLVCFGNVVGDDAYFLAENDRHPARLDCCLVGDTSKGRKGTSRGRVLKIFEELDPNWVCSNVKSGLSSGEGLIYHVRDPVEAQKPVYEKKKIVGYETHIVDPGVKDKRMLVLEDEFASALKVLRREGNTLSPTLRRAWDNGNLHILTKNNPIQSTGAHISLLGHITRQELLRHLTETEYANGFGNRFLWVLVRRSRILPFGGNLSDQALAPVVDSIRSALEFAATQRQILRDSEADELWGEIYPHLSSAGPGLLGAITARAEAQTMRIALIYALLDRSPLIRLVHLRAALAVWAYAFNSAKCIFGLKTGDPVADKVLENLQKCAEGTTVTALHRAFSNNLPGNRLSEALRTLEKEGLARQHIISLEEGVELRWFAKV